MLGIICGGLTTIAVVVIGVDARGALACTSPRRGEAIVGGICTLKNIFNGRPLLCMKKVSILSTTWNALGIILVVERCMMSLIGLHNPLFYLTNVIYYGSFILSLLLNTWNS